MAFNNMPPSQLQMVAVTLLELPLQVAQEALHAWQILANTLPKTNSSPLRMVVSNSNLLFQGAPIFRREMLVSGRVNVFGNWFYFYDLKSRY